MLCCYFIQAVFGRSRGFLTLIVPGLPDGQPCLSVGDKLSVTVNSHMQPVEYEGYIHDVSAYSVTYITHSLNVDETTQHGM